MTLVSTGFSITSVTCFGSSFTSRGFFLGSRSSNLLVSLTAGVITFAARAVLEIMSSILIGKSPETEESLFKISSISEIGS